MENRITNSAQNIDRRYGEEYFHGQGSGYKPEGYEKEHADWSGLIRWVQSCFSSPIRWLDAGCAYGFLVEQAAKEGVEAYGVDISSYALHQNGKVRGKLAQGLAHELPFQEQVFDVVSLFDLIEHVDDPAAVMEAAESALKPSGILFFSTPDPIYFQRDEPTHIHEHPPSCWVDWLKDRGWNTVIRFGGEPYELEIAACRETGEAWDRIRNEFQSQYCPLTTRIVQTGEDFLCCIRAPRAVESLIEKTVIYLLNSSKNPQQFTFSLLSGDERHPDLFAGDLKLRYLEHQETDEGALHRWSAIPLPPGGHDITWRVEGEPVQVIRLLVEAKAMDTRQFLEELPFDHYQRYQFVSTLLNQISEESLTVLDAGGALGRLHLFAPRHRITVLDRVWEDWPGSLKYSGSVIPFSDCAFDVVVSVDTLEHIPTQDRASFLMELCRLARRAVIVCGPFNDPDVAETEAILREYLTHHLHRRDRFLEEHAQNGLPSRDETIGIFRSQSFSSIDFANGYLPRWLSMQMASFALGSAPELAEGARRLNALYNRNYYEADNHSPCYRSIIAAFRESIPGSLHAMRTQRDAGVDGGSVWPIADLIVSLSMLGVLREKDSYLSDQGERLGRFLDHLKNLENTIQEDRKHAANLEAYLNAQATRMDNLQKHGENLVHLLEEQKQECKNLQQHSENLHEHGENLERLLEEQKKERENLLALASDAQKRNEELAKHGSNLESLLHSIQQHASNLEILLHENQKHTRNLEDLLQSQENQFFQMIARLGFDTPISFLDGLPHVEARIQNLINDNHNLYESLEAIYQTRIYRIMRKLGWNPTGREP